MTEPDPYFALSLTDDEVAAIVDVWGLPIPPGLRSLDEPDDLSAAAGYRSLVVRDLVGDEDTLAPAPSALLAALYEAQRRVCIEDRAGEEDRVRSVHLGPEAAVLHDRAPAGIHRFVVRPPLSPAMVLPGLLQLVDRDSATRAAIELSADALTRLLVDGGALSAGCSVSPSEARVVVLTAFRTERGSEAEESLMVLDAGQGGLWDLRRTADDVSLLPVTAAAVQERLLTFLDVAPAASAGLSGP